MAEKIKLNKNSLRDQNQSLKLYLEFLPTLELRKQQLQSEVATAQKEMDRAVAAGYWQLYRYNPINGQEGKNPFILDSKEPDWTKFQEFLNNEVRYTSLQKMFPEEATELFKAAEESARWRYNNYRRLMETKYEN